jgi:uncharacterized protein YuzB (UPF0349 family)
MSVVAFSLETMITIALSECTECGGDALVRVVQVSETSDEVELAEYQCLGSCGIELALPIAA